MQWHDLGKSEKAEARVIAARYGTTVSQVVKYWEDYLSLDMGAMTVEEFVKKTGNRVNGKTE